MHLWRELELMYYIVIVVVFTVMLIFIKQCHIYVKQILYWTFVGTWRVFKGQASSWTAWPLKMGSICRPETSVLNQPALHNNTEDRRIQLLFNLNLCTTRKNHMALFHTVWRMTSFCHDGRVHSGEVHHCGISHSPYSPDPAPFYFFLCLKVTTTVNENFRHPFH
jgi:hypothetical protein